MALIAPLLIWLPLLLLPFIFFLRKNKKHVHKHFPPSPPKLPLIGNLHQVGPSPDHQVLCKLSKKYGPVMLLHLGQVPTVVVSSAEAAKEVLKTYDLLCCSRPTYAGSRRLTYNYLDIAFSPYGDYWRDIRKICVVEFFSVKRVQSHRSLREEEVAKMVKSISDSSTSGAPVDLTDNLFGFVASTIFRIGFGISLHETKYKSGKDIHHLLQDIETMIGGRSWGEHFPSWIGWTIDRVTGMHKHFDRLSNELDQFFQQLIDDHLTPGRTQREQEHEDIIDVLLKTMREETGVVGAAKLGHDSIKAVILNLILGGIDASSVTMGVAMGELAKNPKKMKRAQEEVRNCVGNKGKVTEDDIEQLHYLKMVIKETLRLYPPVPLLLPRETMSHFKLQGYDIEPQTQIYVNDWAITRDPENWKDPDKFIPERFDGSSIDFKGNHFEYLPFGGGRRICPGLFMGTTSVEIALANLLYWFDWKLPHGMKEQDLIVSKRANVNLVPVKFSQNITT